MSWEEGIKTGGVEKVVKCLTVSYLFYLIYFYE